jgi:hypothetical protein
MSNFIQLATDAYIKNGILGIGEPLPGELGDFAFREANRMLDQWNVQALFSWTKTILLFNLTARTLPQYWFTIGPSGGTAAPDFVAPQPTRIIRGNLILTQSSPSSRVPMEIWDARQWAAETVPALGTTVPNNLYYDYQNAPNGVDSNGNALQLSNLYIWPYPTTTLNQVELFTESQVARFASVADVFSMPMGYEDAFMLTLSERLCEGLRDISPTLSAAAMKARANVKSLNSRSPKIWTTDSGMPGSARGSGGASNFYSGWPVQV